MGSGGFLSMLWAEEELPFRLAAYPGALGVLERSQCRTDSLGPPLCPYPGPGGQGRWSSHLLAGLHLLGRAEGGCSRAQRPRAVVHLCPTWGPVGRGQGSHSCRSREAAHLAGGHGA